MPSSLLPSYVLARRHDAIWQSQAHHPTMVCFAADSHRCAREAPGTVVATDTASVDAGFANGAVLRGASYRYSNATMTGTACAPSVGTRTRSVAMLWPAC